MSRERQGILFIAPNSGFAKTWISGKVRDNLTAVMTSGSAGGLKNREPLKADYRWRQLKVAFPLLPSSGARATTQAPGNVNPPKADPQPSGGSTLGNYPFDLEKTHP